MDDPILILIEDAIKNKNEKSIEKVSSIIEMDIPQTKIFLKYFHKFNIFSGILDSKYVNYFNNICLKQLKEKDDFTDENFAKTISLFIKLKRKNKIWYYVYLSTENDFKLEILILSQLDYKSFQFDILYNRGLYSKLKDNLNIFNYIKTEDYYTFESITYDLIENLIDCPSINIVDIDNMGFDKILQYSRKYKNRIKIIEFSYFRQFDKLKELIELNKESLYNYPHSNFEYLIPLKNAYILTLVNSKGIISNEYDFSKITLVNIFFILNEKDKCPNVETIKFSFIPSKNLLYILENIHCPKIKKISAICNDLQKDYDWTKLFENMPLIEELKIDDETSSSSIYNIYPIFYAKKNNLSLSLSFPLIEVLIRNYLNGSPDRSIELNFNEGFEEFWDYFKNKKDILSRVSKLKVKGDNISLDSYFKITIDNYETIDKIKQAKYYYFYVESTFDEKIMEFIKKNKIEYLFILHGGKYNIDDFKECNDLKFVYDNDSKCFLYRNKDNNNLEKF